MWERIAIMWFSHSFWHLSTGTEDGCTSNSKPVVDSGCLMGLSGKRHQCTDVCDIFIMKRGHLLKGEGSWPCFVHWKGTLEGTSSSFIYHRSFQEGTWAVFFLFFANIRPQGAELNMPHRAVKERSVLGIQHKMRTSLPNRMRHNNDFFVFITIWSQIRKWQ